MIDDINNDDDGFCKMLTNDHRGACGHKTHRGDTQEIVTLRLRDLLNFLSTTK